MRRFSAIWVNLKLLIRKITTYLKKVFSKEVVIFLIFLLISIFFWTLQSLQNIKEFDLTVSVTYREIPEKFSITNKLPDKLRVTLRDKGTLMYYYYKHLKDLSLQIDPMEWYRSEGLNRIPSGTLESRIRYKLRSSTQLLSINPDTISIIFVEKTSRTVSVVLKQNVTLAPQFMLPNHPVVTPSTVTIYAPPSILNHIDSVETEMLEVEDLKDTTTFSVNLKPIEGVRFSRKTVKVHFEVEEFTERSLMVPIIGAGFPLDEVLLSFPSEVKLSFFVGLSSYSKISKKDFQVTVNYDRLIGSKDKMQKPLITKYPATVRNIRVQPETVDCLIEKK